MARLEPRVCGSQRNASSTKDAAAVPSGMVRPRPRYLVRGQMHVTERQGDADRRAGARLALHADGAAVQADQFMHQCQADAGAFHGASALALDAMEAIEDTAAVPARECRRRCR